MAPRSSRSNSTMNSSSTRRDFFKVTALGAAAVAVAPTAAAMNLPAPATPAKLRISCQEGVAPGKTLAEKLDFMEANGFDGVEFWGGGLAGRVEEIKTALAGRKLQISAICAGFKGCLIAENEAEQQQAMTTIKEILTATGALGSVGMIIVPAFNGQTKMDPWAARELLLTKLADLGDHAAKAGTTVLLEPLMRDESHFLRQVADATKIAQESKSPGVCVMADFWHMTWEEPSDLAAITAAGGKLRHVHIASRKTRKIPGEDAGDNYVNGFTGLKLIGYQNFVSLECGNKGDKKVVLPAAVKLMRDQWAQA